MGWDETNTEEGRRGRKSRDTKYSPVWKTQLRLLAWLVVREHVRLNHERDIRVVLSQFLYKRTSVSVS